MTSSPEGYDLMLWGDLKILFEPDDEDEVWRNQHEYNLISWRLFDSCGIHNLLMNNGIVIHMMIEKKYPLTQEMLSKMLSRKLEVDYVNEMAFELLRFIRSQVTDIQEKDKNRSQNDKTEHENGKSVKEKSSQSQKSTKSQSQIKSSQPREVDLERASKTEPEYERNKDCLCNTLIYFQGPFLPFPKLQITAGILFIISLDSVLTSRQNIIPLSSPLCRPTLSHLTQLAYTLAIIYTLIRL
ncbi:hypothetical protein Tco_0004987 [Tanacetum coccineum]